MYSECAAKVNIAPTAWYRNACVEDAQSKNRTTAPRVRALAVYLPMEIRPRAELSVRAPAQLARKVLPHLSVSLSRRIVSSARKVTKEKDKRGPSHVPPYRRQGRCSFVANPQ